MALADHSAPGTSAAFAYQFERALLWLAKSPAGATVGIETEDDIVQRLANGTTLLEQDKHSIQEQASPFEARSKDLWNTLATWVEAVVANEVDPAKTEFIMATNRPVPDGLAKQISCAETAEDISNCISGLESAAKNPPEKIKSLVARVLRAEARAALRTVILGCRLVDDSQHSAGPALRDETLAHLQLPQWCSAVADSIVNELLGWLAKTALAAWQNRQPALVQRDHFVNQLHACIDLRRRRLTRVRIPAIVNTKIAHREHPIGHLNRSEATLV